MCQRKFIAVLLFGLVFASMAGCSGDDSNASDAAGGAAGGSSAGAGGGASGVGGATGVGGIAGQPPATGVGGAAGSGGPTGLGGTGGSGGTPAAGGSTAAGGSAGSSGTADGGDGSSEGGSQLPMAPTGGGYCCPIGTPSCSSFPYGGWVAVDDPNQCPRAWDMGPPGTVGLDKHGCSYLFSTSSCNNPPWRPDAGDAASDVKDGASDEDGGDARTGDL